MATKYKPSKEVARIIGDVGRAPIIPDRTVDVEGGSLFSQLIRGEKHSIDKGRSIPDASRRLARVCISPRVGNLRLFLNFVGVDGSDAASEAQIVVYCPSIHSYIPDPFSEAKKAGVWPYSDDPGQQKYESLVYSLLPDDAYSSSTISFMSNNEKLAEEFSELEPGDWVQVGYLDELNKTDGIYISKVSNATPSDGSEGLPGSKAAHKSAAHRRPPVPIDPEQARAAANKSLSKSPQLSSGASLDESSDDQVEWLINAKITGHARWSQPRGNPKGSKLHQGVDLYAKEGSQVFSVSDGVVEWAGTMSGYGLMVLVYSPSNDAQFLYSHLSNVTVQLEQTVTPGTLVGHIGKTAHYRKGHPSYVERTKGKFFKDDRPHLHFEILQGRGPINRRQEHRRAQIGDPRSWLKGQGISESSGKKW